MMLGHIEIKFEKIKFRNKIVFKSTMAIDWKSNAIAIIADRETGVFRHHMGAQLKTSLKPPRKIAARYYIGACNWDRF